MGWSHSWEATDHIQEERAGCAAPVNSGWAAYAESLVLLQCLPCGAGTGSNSLSLPGQHGEDLSPKAPRPVPCAAAIPPGWALLPGSPHCCSVVTDAAIACLSPPLPALPLPCGVGLCKQENIPSSPSLSLSARVYVNTSGDWGGWFALRLDPFPSGAQTERCLLPTTTPSRGESSIPQHLPTVPLGVPPILVGPPHSCNSLGSRLK